MNGNILLDFDETDPLLMVGRLCLALTITLSFPLVVKPSSDMIICSITLLMMTGNSNDQSDNSLSEPLLVNDKAVEKGEAAIVSSSDEQQDADSIPTLSYSIRVFTTIVFFWGPALFGSYFNSIGDVWNLLGSLLLIIMCILIPCGSYLAIMKGPIQCYRRKLISWSLVAVFVPLMIACTASAVQNVFL